MSNSYISITVRFSVLLGSVDLSKPYFYVLDYYPKTPYIVGATTYDNIGYIILSAILIYIEKI